MNTKELREYFFKVLNPDNKGFQDGVVNDLQIDCENENIKKIAFGVTASLEFLEKAKEFGADVVVLHHGIGLRDKYINNSVPILPIQRRLKFLYQNNISLFGFHFLLDADENLGHNALALKNLGLNDLEGFGELKGPSSGFSHWGWKSKFDEDIDINEIFEKLNELYLGNAQIYQFGSKKIKKIGVVTGGASSCIHEAYNEDLDLFVTGEVAEATQGFAKEYGINIIWGGHYITERVGVLALMERVKKDLDVECEFIEVMNKI